MWTKDNRACLNLYSIIFFLFKYYCFRIKFFGWLIFISDQFAKSQRITGKPDPSGDLASTSNFT